MRFGTYPLTARIWDAATGRQIHKLTDHEGYVHGVAFSPDGTKFATASLDNTAALWDVASGRGLHELTGHNQPVVRASFSRDGRPLATASWDRTARLWDVESDREILSLSHAGPVHVAAFSPDGNRLATAGSKRALPLNILDLDALAKLARERITRTLTAPECARYLRATNSPDPRTPSPQATARPETGR